MRRALLFLLSAVLGCSGSTRPAGRTGASIGIVAGGQVAVVNTDQGSVSLFDPETLAVTATIPVGGEPRALLPLRSGKLLVSTYRTGEVVLIDLSAPAVPIVSRRQTVCAGPYGLAEAPDGSFVALACEWDGTVVRLDPESLAPQVLASALRRPRAVAVIDQDIYVAEFTGGTVRRIAAAGPAWTTSLVPTAAAYRPALTTMTVSQVAALLPAFGALYASHLLVNNNGNQSVEKVADDYGSVLDASPKINPAVTALAVDSGEPSDAPVTYAEYTGGSRIFNGPVALAELPPHYLLVAHESTANVAVLDTTATAPTARTVASFATGAGPRGIAVDDSAEVAYVDNALDQSVSKIYLRLPGKLGDPAYSAVMTRVRTLPQRFSAAARNGRRLFHQAADPHLTPAAVVACSTCHPDGGDDGLVWFIHTSRIPLKRRRTPHLGSAHTGTLLLHWDGQFSTMHDLVRSTITDLMAGDALLVDVDSIQPYVDEIVQAPQLPPADPAAVARGQLLFQSDRVGCQRCHQPPAFTDNQKYAPLQPMSLHSDDLISAAKTPGLKGLFLRAPYFHDGRAVDLQDLLTRSDASAHGSTAGLLAGERADLIAYLRSL